MNFLCWLILLSLCNSAPITTNTFLFSINVLIKIFVNCYRDLRGKCSMVIFHSINDFPLFSLRQLFWTTKSRGVFITFHALESRLITPLTMKRLLFIAFPIMKYKSPFLNKFIIIFRPQRSFLGFATDFVLFGVFFQEQVTG